MGLFDFLASNPEKRLRSMRKKVTERYGPPENRQKVIEQLIELGTSEAIGTLMMRFTVTAEPSITDAEEKEHTFQSIVSFGEAAVEPVKTFLRTSEVATSWALKILHQLIDAPDVVSECIAVLERLGPEYTRDPEKKLVLIDTLGDLNDARIVPALLPFLGDPADDVRIAVARALAKRTDSNARVPLLEALVASGDRARVVANLVEALAESGMGVQGYREKVEQLLPDGYLIDRTGLIKRRG